MYGGRIVEQADVKELFRSPRHPYTRGLISCVPNAQRYRADDGSRLRMTPIAGDVPNLIDPPDGCAFHPRCPYAIERCRHDAPPFEPVAEGHASRCWRTREI